MCHGSRDAMAATGSAPCGWLLLTGRDNTCKYNPAGFHGAFNVSRACGMDIAHACPRVENFRKKWEVGEKSGAEFRTCPDLDNSSCGIIIFCDWSLTRISWFFRDTAKRRFVFIANGLFNDGTRPSYAVTTRGKTSLSTRPFEYRKYFAFQFNPFNLFSTELYKFSTGSLMFSSRWNRKIRILNNFNLNPWILDRNNWYSGREDRK